MPEKKPTFVPFTDDELCALEDAFGRIEVVTAAAPTPRPWRKDDAPEPPWQAVFASPTSMQSKRFEASANSDSPAQKADGIRNLSVDCIVGLSRLGAKTIAVARGADQKAVAEAWRKLREDEGFPAAHIAASGALIKLLGMTAEDAGKD